MFGMILSGHFTVQHRGGVPRPSSVTHTHTHWAHIGLQQVVHAGLGHVLGLVELLQRLPDLLVWDLALSLLLVVVVQPPALQLLKVVLGGGGRE